MLTAQQRSRSNIPYIKLTLRSMVVFLQVTVQYGM